MELIYLYIEDDKRNIKNCEFNFSPKYRIHYEQEKKELIIKEESDYIENFWEASNISNITAIIGKNGTGKSNLIKFLLEKHKGKSTIYIYIINKELKIRTNISELKTDKEFVEESVICYPTIFHSPNIYPTLHL